MHPEIRYLYKKIGGPWPGYYNTKTCYRLDKTKIVSCKKEAGIPHSDTILGIINKTKDADDPPPGIEPKPVLLECYTQCLYPLHHQGTLHESKLEAICRDKSVQLVHKCLLTEAGCGAPRLAFYHLDGG